MLKVEFFLTLLTQLFIYTTLNTLCTYKNALHQPGDDYGVFPNIMLIAVVQVKYH